MNEKVLILKQLCRIYSNYGDNTSFDQIKTFILTESEQRISQIEYRTTPKYDKSLQLPVGKFFDDDIIFFNPSKKLLKKLPTENVQSDSLYITNNLIKLIRIAC